MASKDESSHCRDCGRALFDPVSRKRGIGPKCWAKRQKQIKDAETNDGIWDSCKAKEAEKP